MIPTVLRRRNRPAAQACRSSHQDDGRCPETRRQGHHALGTGFPSPTLQPTWNGVPQPGCPQTASKIPVRKRADHLPRPTVTRPDQPDQRPVPAGSRSHLGNGAGLNGPPPPALTKVASASRPTTSAATATTGSSHRAVHSEGRIARHQRKRLVHRLRRQHQSKGSTMRPLNCPLKRACRPLDEQNSRSSRRATPREHQPRPRSEAVSQYGSWYAAPMHWRREPPQLGLTRHLDAALPPERGLLSPHERVRIKQVAFGHPPRRAPHSAARRRTCPAAGIRRSPAPATGTKRATGSRRLEAMLMVVLLDLHQAAPTDAHLLVPSPSSCIDGPGEKATLVNHTLVRCAAAHPHGRGRSRTGRPSESGP